MSHTDDILCLVPHSSLDLVATGQIGRDPAVHVWDAATLETQSILKGGHSRGVCTVGFSGKWGGGGGGGGGGECC